MKRMIVAIVLGVLGVVSTARADVSLSALFGDHMVLQRDMGVPVWGKAAPGEEVAVAVAGQRKSAKADAQGAWKVTLDPLQAAESLEMTVSGANTLTFHDVAVGEVWICSGQSNMVWNLKDASDSQREVAAAAHPAIRLFAVGGSVAETPRHEISGHWVPCSPTSAASFSAVAYCFGREVQQALKVPVGLVLSAVGATPAEAWTAHPVLEGDPQFRSILDGWDQAVKGYPEALKKQKAWEEAAAKAKAEGKPAPPAPFFLGPPGAPGHIFTPSGLYNGMIAPLVPYGIRGAIWYQGESNAGRAAQYRQLFPAMIRDWRRAWGQGDFPFLFVQLAGFKANGTWSALREAQVSTLSVPKTGMAVAIDIGEAGNIHPGNKQEVGRRLAFAALATVYGRELAYTGPVYDGMSVEGDRLRLRFRGAAGGLMAKGSLTGFEVAGEDHRFFPAEAALEGGAVLVGSPKVPHPVAARYAWADFPACTLADAAGLPAGPFRTDDWPDPGDGVQPQRP